MGKGKRTKVAYEQAKVIEQEKKLLEKKKKRKNNLITLIVVVSLAAFSAVAIGGSFWYNARTADGTFLRKKAAIKTDNFSINVCMAQYFFNSAVQNYVSQNSEYLEDMGLDTTADLKTQPSYEDEEKSWYDYFLENTESQMYEVLSLCEAAKEKGYELDEGDEKTIKDTLDSIEENADSQNQTVEEYIAETYGSTVKIEDIEDSLRLTTLAGKYYSEYVGDLEFTDSQIEEYFNENKASFLTADYIAYFISNEATGEETDSELRILNDKAKKQAKKIADAKNRSEFEDNLTDYFEDYLKSNNSELSEDDIKSQAESALSNCSVTDEAYNTDTALGQWVFSEKRKSGDTAVVEDSEQGGYYAVYLVTPAAKDTSETKNVRHILLGLENYDDSEACEKAAEKILKEWRNGEKTEESFGELAKKYSTDPGSASVGGLYENVTEGAMVTEFNDWIFSSKRKAGDTDLVETDYGWHIMYFVGDGLTAWKADVVTSLKNESYTKKLDELKKQYEATTKDKNLQLVEYIPEEAEESDEEDSYTVE